MATAFILINTQMGKEEEVVNELKSITQVKEIDLVYGVYDIIARIEAPNLDEINLDLNEKIRKIDAIQGTIMMIANEE